MWRLIHSIGRGLRSARPSQCCPQDCSDEGSIKYDNHYNKISKTQAATLRHYSGVLRWSPLTIKSNDNTFQETTSSSTQAVCLSHCSYSKADERVYTKSYENGSPDTCTERRDSASYHPRCPPWHWQILQDNGKLEKCCSEKEEKEEKQNTNGWEKTCHSQEWKEILQASPTLQALGWGSAAALTLSLYHDWNEHHPCPHQKKDEQEQTLPRSSRRCTLDPKDVNNQEMKNEETWNYHIPFKDFFTSENNSQEVSSESPDAENHYKSYLGEIYKVSNLYCNFRSTKIYKSNLEKSYESKTQESVMPVYSIQQKFLDVARRASSSQENYYINEEYKLKEICQDEDELHVMNESPFSPEDKWSDVWDKADSGCISDLNQSFQSKTCSTNLDIAQNQCNQDEEGNVSNTVSDISSERHVTEPLEFQLPAEEKGDVSEHHQPVTQNEAVNSFDDNDMKMLHDRLLEIVKAHHEERLSNMLKRDGKTSLDTKPEEMVVYFQAGVLMGDTTSAFNLALCYHMGHGVTQNLEKARKLYEVASAAGHGWATYNLAVMLNQGLGGPVLPKKSHNMLLQAAQMGVKEAEDALSVLEEEKQQLTVSREECKPNLRRCYSEPCLFSALDSEWSPSYSTGDLQSLLDEEDWAGGDFTVANVSLKI